MDIPGFADVPWWVLLITLIVIYLAYSARDYNYFYKQGIPFGPPIPPFGNMYFILFMDGIKAELAGVEFAKKKGCLGAFIGSSPFLVVHDEEMISQIMVKEFSAFTNRMVVTTGSLNDLMLGNRRDGYWKHARSEMTPTFTSGKLKKMNTEVNRCAVALTDSLNEAANSGENVEMKEYMGAFTMDVIASTAFGFRVESLKDRNNAFIQHAKKSFDFGFTDPIKFLRLLSPSLNALLSKLGFPYRFMPKESEDFFYEICKQAMEMRKTDADQSRTDFLQLMINTQREEKTTDHEDNKEGEDQVNGSGLSAEEILANALVFFVAGYDTTASSLSFFMHNMAANPECQAKLVEEIQKHVGSKDFVDYSVLQEMTYLDKCINESLRKYPVVLQTTRQASRDVTIKGVHIRKGMSVGVAVYSIHHDPSKWPEPEKFDPERFSPENKKDRSPFHFMPFGYGPRNCIGMRLAILELKVVIIHVLKRFRVIPCEKTENPIKLVNTGLLKPKNGIWLRMVPRNGE